MNIEFTKEQYEQLIKAVYMGNWMANANRTDDMITEFADIEEYVLSHAKDFGLEHLAALDDEDGQTVVPSPELEADEELDRIIEEYDDETFWEELIERMTIKDIFSSIDEEDVESMKEEEFVELHETIRTKYEEEFAENGVMNIDLYTDEDDCEECCDGTCVCEEEKDCC
ncbi:MAG: hypothetical protein WC819_06465 [Parcubacteria group bacterium]|jgi:hypothetical protein